MIRVLLVEDKKITREETAETLQDNGFFTETAVDAECCLEQLKKGAESGSPFDAVVLDLYMPGRNGNEIVPEIRRDYPYTTIIIVTAFHSVPTAIQTLRRGAYQYLTKPYDTFDQIIPVLRAGVAQNRLRRMRQELLTSLGPQELYPRVADIVRQAIPGRSHFYLAVVSPQENNLSVRAWDEMGRDIDPTHSIADREHPLVKRVLDDQVVVRCNKAKEISAWQPLGPQSRSLIAAPIKGVGGESEGLVNLECAEEVTFDEYTEEVLVSLAELIALERGIARRVDVEVEAARQTADQLALAAKQCAHYIRNSVHALRASFGLLREAADAATLDQLKKLSKRVNAHLRHEDACDEIEDVLMELAAVSQPIQPRLADADLAQTFNERLSNYETMADHAGVEFRFVPPATGVLVRADEKLLRRAVDMLVENAIEACGAQPPSQDKPEVVVDISYNQRSAAIRVRDNGPGIPIEDINRLFEPRFSSKQHSPLRGIGLFTAQRIALEHGGRIWVNRQIRRGAEFILELPRQTCND